jgi:DNA-binding CsgD family transcriptional regulator
VSNYSPEWTDRYLGRHYERLDPVIAQAAAADGAFSWTRRTNRGRSRDQVKFFDEAALFGIGRGFTIPIPVKGSSARSAALTFAARENASSFQRSVDLHGTALQLGAIYFHKQLRRALSVERVVAGVRLTKREFQCLHWAARGKTLGEIGGILTISRRTAAFHLDNARAKLGVHSIIEAVALFAASHRPG